MSDNVNTNGTEGTMQTSTTHTQTTPIHAGNGIHNRLSGLKIDRGEVDPPISEHMNTPSSTTGTVVAEAINLTGLVRLMNEQADRIEAQAERMFRERQTILAAVLGPAVVKDIADDPVLDTYAGGDQVRDFLLRLKSTALDYAGALEGSASLVRAKAAQLREAAVLLGGPTPLKVSPPAGTTDTAVFSLDSFSRDAVLRMAGRRWTQPEVDEWAKAHTMTAPTLVEFNQAVWNATYGPQGVMNQDEKETFACGSCDRDVEGDPASSHPELGNICRECHEQAEESYRREQEVEADEDFGEDLVEEHDHDAAEEQQINDDIETPEPEERPLTLEEARQKVLEGHPRAKVRTRGKSRGVRYKIMDGTRNLTPFMKTPLEAWTAAAEGKPNW